MTLLFLFHNGLLFFTASPNDLVSKLWAYNRANREVAILCNHQRSPPKRYNFQLKNVKEKVKRNQSIILLNAFYKKSLLKSLQRSSEFSSSEIKNREMILDQEEVAGN